MRWLSITHPATGGTAQIAESTLAYHLRAGWQVSPPLEPSAPPSDEGGELVPDASGAPDPGATPDIASPARAAVNATDEIGE
jgi:hypothetical protein